MYVKALNMQPLVFRHCSLTLPFLKLAVMKKFNSLMIVGVMKR